MEGGRGNALKTRMEVECGSAGTEVDPKQHELGRCNDESKDIYHKNDSDGHHS